MIFGRNLFTSSKHQHGKAHYRLCSWWGLLTNDHDGMHSHESALAMTAVTSYYLRIAKSNK